MIISGQQLGRARRWLATHLQNAADNEVIEVAEVSGTVASDIDGAITEMDALTYATNATEGVYAAFINPPKALTREQFMRAIALIEERLGLSGQPRIVMFHVKNGRHHCHIVWSRIDIDRRRAIHLSHDRQKLRAVARELAGEFDLPLPPGLERDRGPQRFSLPKQPTRAEKAQAKQSGITPEERRAAITDAWRKADSAEAFVNALEQAGYLLARGDKRSFVVIDIAGDVHSLARQIDGAKTKDVKAKLEGINLALLPSVERGKLLMAQRRLAQADAAHAVAKRNSESEAAWERLQALQRKRRLAIDLLWQQMKIRHAHEWKVLHAEFFAARRRYMLRRAFNAWGLVIYLKKIAVIRQLMEYYEHKKHKALEEYHRFLERGLQRRHEHEAAELRRRYDALARLEKREFISFAQQYPGSVDQKAFSITGYSHSFEHRSAGQHPYRFGQSQLTPTIGPGHPLHGNMQGTLRELTEGSALDGVEIVRSGAYDWQRPPAAFTENAMDMTRPPQTVSISPFRKNANEITAPAYGARIETTLSAPPLQPSAITVTIGVPCEA